MREIPIQETVELLLSIQASVESILEITNKDLEEEKGLALIKKIAEDKGYKLVWRNGTWHKTVGRIWEENGITNYFADDDDDPVILRRFRQLAAQVAHDGMRSYVELREKYRKTKNERLKEELLTDIEGIRWWILNEDRYFSALDITLTNRQIMHKLDRIESVKEWRNMLRRPSQG